MQPEIRPAGGAVRERIILHIGATDQDLESGIRHKAQRRARRGFLLFPPALRAQKAGLAQLLPDLGEIALRLGAGNLIQNAVEIAEILLPFRDQNIQMLLGGLGFAVLLIERCGVLLRRLQHIERDLDGRKQRIVEILRPEHAVALFHAIEIGCDEIRAAAQCLAILASAKLLTLKGKLFRGAVAQRFHALLQRLRAAAHGLRFVAPQIIFIQKRTEALTGLARDCTPILLHGKIRKVAQLISLAQKDRLKISRIHRIAQRLEHTAQALLLGQRKRFDARTCVAERTVTDLPANERRKS